jgi:hypothetical protein
LTPRLASCWQFAYEDLAGYITGGNEHGIELTSGADRRPVTRPLCLSLEHYYAANCGGGFCVPRQKAPARSEQLSDTEVRIEIDPWGDWQVRPTITYRLLPDRVLQAVYEFAFAADYQCFEAFITNYFHDLTPAYLHVGGRWIEPRLAADELRFWPRDEAEKGMIPTVYAEQQASWKANFGGDVIVDAACYDRPVMVRATNVPDWSLIHVVERDMCPSLSASDLLKALDFSLVGRDVAAGETVRCHAWMAYAKLGSLDDALALAAQLATAQEA